MKRLNNDQIMDYLDGKLSAEEVGRVEAHLEVCSEDAELVRELRFATAALTEVREQEEFRVSENFWPELREKLGPVPRRSLLSRLALGVAGLTGPSRSGRLSVGAAFAAIVLAMGFFLFSPREVTHQAVAGAMTPADIAFVQSSADRHEAYVAAEPVVPGDTSVRETGADYDDEGNHH